MQLRAQGYLSTGYRGDIRWTPHPVILTIRDKKDYIWVLIPGGSSQDRCSALVGKAGVSDLGLRTFGLGIGHEA